MVDLPRIFRRMLRLFPIEFRERHEREMSRVFEQQVRDGSGRAARAGLLVSACVDVLRLAPREHLAILCQDLRYAWRALFAQPAFAVTALLTIALGIGGTTAIVALLDTMFLRPLPFEAGDRLIRIDQFSQSPNGEIRRSTTTGRNADALRARTDLFDGVLAEIGTSVTLPGETPERIAAARVSRDFTQVLRVRPWRGRAFSPEEERAGDDSTAVLVSHRLWETRFAGRESLAGASIHFNGRRRDIVGVLPNAFRFPYDAEIWMPSRVEEAPGSVLVIARLRDGVTVEQVNAELTGLASRLARLYPNSNANVGLTAMPLRRNFTEGADRVPFLLLGAVVFLFLIACANIAQLLLVRFVGRQRELAIRAALGAGRVRQLRQFVTESLLLFALGGAAGFVVASWLRGFLVLLLPHTLREQLGLAAIALDARVALFSTALALASGLVAGTIAATRASTRDVNSLLKEESRTAGSPRSRRMLGAAAAAEIALALVLLTGAAVTLGTFRQLVTRNVGFDTRSLLTLQVDLTSDRYASGERRLGFLKRALEAVAAVPGIAAAAATTVNPLCCGDWGALISVEGLPAQSEGSRLVVHHRYVSPGFFRTMGIRLLRGRAFTAADGMRTAPVVVVDERMARRFWPGQDPIGKRVKRGLPESPQPWMTVVGVVSAVEDAGDYDETWYLPYNQYPLGPSANTLHFMVRLAGEPDGLIPAVRRAIAQADPALGAYDVAMMEDIRSESLQEEQLGALLVTAFAAFGLLLAAIGIYGVITHTVRLRTREIGLRLALGARTWRVLADVLRRGMGLAAGGILLGTAGIYLLRTALRAWIGEIPPVGVPVVAGVAAAVTFVALVACWIPAQRAMRIDPVRALND